MLRSKPDESGNRVAAGVAVVACGSEPTSSCAEHSARRAAWFAVSEYLETEEKGIYAVGDLAFYPDRIMGESAADPLGKCSRQGLW